MIRRRAAASAHAASEGLLSFGRPVGQAAIGVRLLTRGGYGTGHAGIIKVADLMGHRDDARVLVIRYGEADVVHG
jgi:hypothetical protein